MQEQIRRICLALKKEAESVVDYTNLLNATEKEEDKRPFESIRFDVVEHIQHLTLELTKTIVGGEPDEDEEKEE